MTVAARFPYMERVTVTTAADGSAEFSFSQVPDGRYRRIERVAFLNPASTTAKLRIVEDIHGYDFLLSEENTLAQNVVYWDADPFYLNELERLTIQVTTGGNASAVVACATGWEGLLGDM